MHKLSIFFILCFGLLLSNLASGQAIDPTIGGGLALPQEQDSVTEGTVSGSFDQTLATANMAFQSLRNRQIQLALTQYQQAAGSNPEYQKMVDFCEALLDRMQESFDEYNELFRRQTSPTFRMETLTREEIKKMLDYQYRSSTAGQALSDMGTIAEIPVSELGLDFEGADQMTLAEYLGWIRPRSANARIYYRTRKRMLERQMTFEKLQIYQQQLQEKVQRVEEARRRRLETSGGSGNFGYMGGGGGMGMMGGMGGGMMGGMGGMY
jgi:hypothetical protein